MPQAPRQRLLRPAQGRSRSFDPTQSEAKTHPWTKAVENSLIVARIADEWFVQEEE
jgi:hypothetical protein